jgi:hypothetical protein
MSIMTITKIVSEDEDLPKNVKKTKNLGCLLEINQCLSNKIGCEEHKRAAK